MHPERKISWSPNEYVTSYLSLLYFYIFIEGSYTSLAGVKTSGIFWKILPKLHNLICILIPEILVLKMYTAGDLTYARGYSTARLIIIEKDRK